MTKRDGRKLPSFAVMHKKVFLLFIDSSFLPEKIWYTKLTEREQ